MRIPLATCLSMIFAASVCAADTDNIERGAGLLAPFKKNLKGALLEGMQKGPEHAIGVCKVDAPAIASELSVNGVAMGRTSHRLRNPRNVPPEWARPILAAWLESESQREPVSVDLGGQRVGYAEPITLEPLCVTCHGSSLAPAVAAKIAADYPEDQATGFEVGDLRGIWWVEFPVATP